MTPAEIEARLRRSKAQLNTYENAEGRIVVTLTRPKARLVPAKVVTRRADRLEDALEFAFLEWDSTWKG